MTTKTSSSTPNTSNGSDHNHGSSGTTYENETGSHTSATLRQALRQLQHYTHSNTNLAPSANLEAFQTMKQRYLHARNAYLRHRITELVAQHLQQQQPPEDCDYHETQQENLALKQAHQEQVRRIQAEVDRVCVQYEALSSKYQTICAESKELEKMICDLEENEKSCSSDSSFDHEPEQEQEQDLGLLQHQMEEQWLTLSSKKLERQKQIQKLKAQIEKADADRAAITEKLKSLTNNNGENFDVTSFGNVQEQIDEVREKIANLRDMAEWYDTVRGALEAMSAMSIENVVRVDRESITASCSDIALEVQVRFQLQGDHQGHYVIGVELCANHHANPSSGTSTDRLFSMTDSRSLRVHKARIIGKNVMKSKDGAVQCTALSSESLAEIVEASRSLVSSSNPCGQQHKHQSNKHGNSSNPLSCDDLKFVLRESLARMRGASQRLQQLELLRKKYLTQIEYTKSRDIDAVICSLDDGITVVLKLTPDCPLLPGSAFIEQIAGLGGWDQSVLTGIQTKVNDLRLKSAIEVMSSVVKEIKRSSLSRPLDISVPNALTE